MSTGTGQSGGAEARAARAAAARAERERRARAAKMRNLAISIAVVVVLAIAAVVVIPRLHSSSTATVVTPAGMTTYKGVQGSAFGPATAPVTITLFEDFQCPVCLHLEQTTGAEFTNLADAGKVRIIYSVVSILDRESNGNKYSTRSASAFYAAPQADRKALHDAFYADQPAEDGHGRPTRRSSRPRGRRGSPRPPSRLMSRTTPTPDTPRSRPPMRVTTTRRTATSVLPPCW